LFLKVEIAASLSRLAMTARMALLKHPLLPPCEKGDVRGVEVIMMLDNNAVKIKDKTF
jgi:hypothetical protein